MLSATKSGKNSSVMKDYTESKMKSLDYLSLVLGLCLPRVCVFSWAVSCHCSTPFHHVIYILLQHGSSLSFLSFNYPSLTILSDCSRERNRMHARKTRERKKQQSNALQTRLNELENEVTAGQPNVNNCS